MSVQTTLHCYLQLLCFRNVGLHQHGHYKVRITGEYLSEDTVLPAKPLYCQQYPQSVEPGVEITGKAGIDEEGSGYESGSFYVDEELEEARMNDICCFEAVMTATASLKTSPLTLVVSLVHRYDRQEGGNVAKVKVHISGPLSGVHEFYQVVFPNEFCSTLDVIIHTSMARCDLPSEVYEDDGVEREVQLKKAFERVVAPVVRDLDALQGMVADVRKYIPDFSSLVTLTQDISPTSWREPDYQLTRYWAYFLEICPSGPSSAVLESLQHMLNYAAFYVNELMSAVLRLGAMRPEIMYAYYVEKKQNYREILANHSVIKRTKAVNSPPLMSPIDIGNRHRVEAGEKRKEAVPIPISQIFDDTNADIQPATMPVLFADMYTMEKEGEPLPVPTSTPSGFHLVVLVNGYMGSNLDMMIIHNYIAKKYNQRVGFLLSRANEGEDTKHDIMELGRRLANEVERYIKDYYANDLGRLSFVGFSLGGVVVRAALCYLEEYKEKMFTLITLSSPHLGLMYSSSVLVDAGVWFLRKFTNTPSLTQLSMKDSSVIQGTCLYQLSQHPGLQWFQHIALFSSADDNYAPIESARIELTEKATNGSEQGYLFIEMAERLLGSVKPERLIRVNVDFVLPVSLDHIVGRKAHLEFLSNHHFLTALTEAFPELFI